MAARCGLAIKSWLNENRAFNQRMYWVKLTTPSPDVPVVGLFSVEPSASLGEDVSGRINSRDLCSRAVASPKIIEDGLGSETSIARS